MGSTGVRCQQSCAVERTGRKIGGVPDFSRKQNGGANYKKNTNRPCSRHRKTNKIEEAKQIGGGGGDGKAENNAAG